MRRIIGLALIVALTVIASVAERTMTQLWQGYQSYASPYLQPLPSGSSRSPMSRRLVVVLVHGLRLAESRQMPAANALRARGADITVEAPPPTYRMPAWFGLLTGARPETHGLTTDASPRFAIPDTLFRALQSAGRPTAVVGTSAWTDLFENAVSRLEIVDEEDPARRDNQAAELAVNILRDPAQPAQVVVVEFGLLEHIARAEPASYSAAAAATDVRLQSIVEALDLSQDTIAVIADRGFDARSRDGGGDAATARVPFILAGAGVTPDAQAIAPASAVAPTLAAVAGAPIPAHAQGPVVLGALAPDPALPLASARQLTSFYEQWSEIARQPRFAAELMRAHEVALASGDPVAYSRWSAELGAAANGAVVAKLTEERTARLPFVAGVGLLLLALAALMLTEHPLHALAGAGAYAVAWFVLFTFVRGESPSLALFPGGDAGPALREFEREAALLLLAACAFIALAAGSHADAFDAATTALATLGLIALFNIAQFMWFYWQWGDAFTWTLPESTALVSAMLALAQVAALSAPIADGWPELPLAVIVTVMAAAIFAAVRRTRRS